MSLNCSRSFSRTKYLLAGIVLAAVALQAQQPAIPGELGTAPLTTGAGSGRRNILNYGATISTAFDDNAANPAELSKGQTDLKSSVQPLMDISIGRARLTARFFYGPSFTYDNKISYYNSTSQAAGADIQYLFTKRLSLHILNAFSLSTNPYESFRASAELPSLGILNGPNPSAIGANVRSTTEQSQADLVYQFGRHTSVGIGGGFTNLKYQTISTGGLASGSNLDSRGRSGHAFYSHQLTARYSLGVQYTAQKLASQSATGRFSSLSHQVLGFFTVALKPTVHLSVFAGPQRSEIDNNFVSLQTPIPSHLGRSSFAGGSSLSWQGEHSGLSASFVQQVSDSGLSGGGSVLVRMVSLQMQRQIIPQLSLNLVGNYVSNNQLDPLSPVVLTDAASVGLGISRVLTQHMTLNLSALRQQFLGSAGNTLQLYRQHSHDIGTVSLSYTFARPIGR